EGPADQDLLAGADVGQRAVDADLVAGDAEAAHVVVGHGAGPAGQGDRSHRLEVQGDPQLRAVGQVDVVDLDRQDAEAAAAAELRLVRGGLPTGDLAVERGAAERLGQRPAGLAAGRGRRRGPVTVSENVPVAVAPAASVTVTVNVEVPVVAGAPSSSPDGRSASPAGGFPDQVYGGCRRWPGRSW